MSSKSHEFTRGEIDGKRDGAAAGVRPEPPAQPQFEDRVDSQSGPWKACRLCGHGIDMHRDGHCISDGCACGMRLDYAGEVRAGILPPKCAEATLDSGHRKVFETGSMRDAPDGKGRYDLISPLALRRLALVLERGAAKYEPRNWELGQPMSQYMNSALRHLCQFTAGYRDEDHLGQALWNIHAAIHTEEMVSAGKLPAALYDLPDYTK